MAKSSTEALSLVHLLENDLLACHVFGHLSTAELVSIRFVSKQFYHTIIHYLTGQFRWQFGSKLGPICFTKSTLTIDCYSAPSCLEFVALANVLIPLASVRCLNLRRCHWLEDSQLRWFGIRCCITLQELYLDSCWNVSNLVLETVLVRCQRLRRLSLARIYAVENRLLRTIAQCLPALSWLDLSHCWRLTDQGIGQLCLVPDQRSKLAHLNLTGCSRVSIDSIARLLTVHHDLTIVHDHAHLFR